MKTDLRITEALAGAVREKLAAEGWTQQDVYDHGGPTMKTLHKILNRVGDPITLTALRRLDDGLGWPQGKAYRLAAGLDHGPRPTTESSREQLIKRLGRSSFFDLPIEGLTTEQLQALADVADIAEAQSRDVDNHTHNGV
jgi:hypothetical protein